MTQHVKCDYTAVPYVLGWNFSQSCSWEFCI